MVGLVAISDDTLLPVEVANIPMPPDVLSTKGVKGVLHISFSYTYAGDRQS